MSKKYLPTEDTHIAIKNTLADIRNSLETIAQNAGSGSGGGGGTVTALNSEEMNDLMFVLKHGSGE